MVGNNIGVLFWNYVFCLIGSSQEQSMYKNMGITDLVQRLITKRCVMFCGGMDSYILLTGHRGCGKDDFLKVGTSRERAPLILENTLSYHEMKV